MLREILGVVLTLSLGHTTPHPKHKLVLTVDLPAAVAPKNDYRGKQVDLAALKGMKLGNLNAQYFGISGAAPAKASIDFEANLGRLWKQKLKIPGVTGATKKSYREILDRYATGDRGVRTIPDFVSEAELVISQSHPSLDYNALCADWDKRVTSSNESVKKKRFLHWGGCSLLRDITGQISGSDLIAYGMTELFPSRKGDVNVVLMETLLKEAGSEYLNSIPALGDPLLSFGFYQFTSHAVRYDTDITKRGGANKVSAYAAVPHRIPDSVKLLTRESHHQAAYYFAVYNIAQLIRHLNPEERRSLRRMYKENMSELAKFMAVAHHNPKHAIRRTKEWVAGGGKKPLVSYLGPKLTIYAEKTGTNRKALDSYLGDPA